MFQTWRDLLFLHWEIDPQEIAKKIPSRLSIDLHQGKAYLGLIPFSMKKVRPRFLPALPWISNFLELNVRTYVYDKNGNPGVWFFSLDCNQPLAVTIAQKLFNLPYQHASMTSDGKNYHCQRRGQTEKATYQYPQMGPLQTATPGSLEFFLLERYLLFSQSSQGTISCGQVHHEPYTFSPVHLPQISHAPLHWEGFHLNSAPISTLASPGLDVSIYPLIPEDPSPLPNPLPKAPIYSK